MSNAYANEQLHLCLYIGSVLVCHVYLSWILKDGLMPSCTAGGIYALHIPLQLILYMLTMFSEMESEDLNLQAVDPLSGVVPNLR